MKTLRKPIRCIGILISDAPGMADLEALPLVMVIIFLNYNDLYWSMDT